MDILSAEAANQLILHLPGKPVVDRAFASPTYGQKVGRVIEAHDSANGVVITLEVDYSRFFRDNVLPGISVA